MFEEPIRSIIKKYKGHYFIIEMYRQLILAKIYDNTYDLLISKEQYIDYKMSEVIKLIKQKISDKDF